MSVEASYMGFEEQYLIIKNIKCVIFLFKNQIIIDFEINLLNISLRVL